MVITSLGRRIRLFAAAVSLACASPALAQPVNDPCHMLWNLAEMTPHLDQLTESIGGAQEVLALRAFDRALRRTPPTALTNVATSSGHLVARVPQLMVYLEALQALRLETAQGNHATARAVAQSSGLRAGAALVQRLLVEHGCRPSGWFMAGAGAEPVQMPVTATKAGAAGLSEHVGVGTLGGGTLLSFAVAALTAGTLLALFGPRAWLRKKFKLSRRHPRYGCGCWTTLGHQGKTHKSLIIDASRIGCRISKPPKLRKGTYVTLDVCGAPVPAKVMWRREYCAGLRFVAALDEDQLAALHQSEQDPFGPATAAGNNSWSGTS